MHLASIRLDVLDVPSLVDLESQTTLHSRLFCSAAYIFLQLFLNPAVGLTVLRISFFRSLSRWAPAGMSQGGGALALPRGNAVKCFVH